MLEESTPLLGAQTQRGIDQTLPYNHVTLSEPSSKQRNVLQAHPATVDEVLVLTGSECAAGDRDFGELDRQPTVGIVEGEGGLGHASRSPALAAAEDNVFSLPGAQRMLPLLAQDPTHGVGDVRLAAPVRPDDPGNPRFEGEDGAVEEALETLNFEAGQTGSAKEGLIVGHRGGVPGNDTSVGTRCACPAQSGWYHRPPGPDNGPAKPMWRSLASDRHPNRNPRRTAWQPAGAPATAIATGAFYWRALPDAHRRRSRRGRSGRPVRSRDHAPDTWRIWLRLHPGAFDTLSKRRIPRPCGPSLATASSPALAIRATGARGPHLVRTRNRRRG